VTDAAGTSDDWHYKASPTLPEGTRTKILLAGAALTLGILSAVTWVLSTTPSPTHNFIVWMNADARGVQIRSARSAAAELPGASCAYWSRAKDYREAVRLLPPTQVTVLSPATTPSSIRCRSTTGLSPATLHRLEYMEGVIEVTQGTRLPISA
jgi:hypothetical protein